MIAIHNIKGVKITKPCDITSSQYQTVIFETDDGKVDVMLYFKTGFEPLQPTVEEKGMRAAKDDQDPLELPDPVDPERIAHEAAAALSDLRQHMDWVCERVGDEEARTAMYFFGLALHHLRRLV